MPRSIQAHCHFSKGQEPRALPHAWRSCTRVTAAGSSCELSPPSLRQSRLRTAAGAGQLTPTMQPPVSVSQQLLVLQNRILGSLHPTAAPHAPTVAQTNPQPLPCHQRWQQHGVSCAPARRGTRDGHGESCQLGPSRGHRHRAGLGLPGHSTRSRGTAGWGRSCHPRVCTAEELRRRARPLSKCVMTHENKLSQDLAEHRARERGQSFSSEGSREHGALPSGTPQPQDKLRGKVCQGRAPRAMALPAPHGMSGS